MSSSILQDKSIAFAIKTVQLYKLLIENEKEFVMSKQLLRSGTSIGANVREAKNAESPLDFIHKLGIAQKETDETLYWLEVLYKSNYISLEDFHDYSLLASELLKMIRSSIMTKKKNL